MSNSKIKKSESQNIPTFQEIMQSLQNYWAGLGCVMLPSFDQEIGAGTLSPYTALHAITEDKFSVCYVQISSRPTDARFGQDSNRSSSYYQFQVLLKPMEDFGNIQNLFLKSLSQIGVELPLHDIKFVEDDWKNESIGAYGLGYEVWYDGMEIAQFTYMQAIGGIDCAIVSCELTYGLERIAMCLQNKNSIFDIIYTNKPDGSKILYSDIHTRQEEVQRSKYNSYYSSDTKELRLRIDKDITEGLKMLDDTINPMVLPAYRKCLFAGHNLNLLDARNAISPNERRDIILQIRKLCQKCTLTHIKDKKQRKIK
ncbi:MAG: glycine--tRNA ligase subunit alpha [Alphaproteobacteria bacterium]|nr:glycine--tRNA ligase subunit alpha [Rickettsiales bacterium]